MATRPAGELIIEHVREHCRRSIRLKDYDYSQSGAYFVTICTYKKECLFGRIANGQMVLNEFGEIALDEWDRTPQIRESVELDEYVIMPNHLHGIIVITSNRRGVLPYAPINTLRHNPNEFRSPSRNIGSIIRGFKSAVARRVNDQRNTPGMPVWQRNYYEHVIRGEEDLNEVREYIINNPLKWDLDSENPVNLKHGNDRRLH